MPRNCHTHKRTVDLGSSLLEHNELDPLALSSSKITISWTHSPRSTANAFLKEWFTLAVLAHMATSK